MKRSIVQRRVAKLVLDVQLGRIGSENRGNLLDVTLGRRIVDGAAGACEVKASPTSRSEESRTKRNAKNKRFGEDVFIVFSNNEF